MAEDDDPTEDEVGAFAGVAVNDVRVVGGSSSVANGSNVADAGALLIVDAAKRSSSGEVPQASTRNAEFCCVGGKLGEELLC